MLFERKITNSKAFAIVQPAVYFHNATNSQLDSFCDKVPYLHLLGRDTINENGINNLIKLARLVGKTSYLFDDLLYQSFRRFLNTPHHSPDVGINITYTPRQKILIESSAGTRQKIRGVAGSGKTKVLAGRAVNAYCRTQNTVLVLTFNLTLRNYIHDRISEVRLSFPWSGFEITNYHQFFKQQANNYNLSYDDFFMADDENFFDSVTESIQRYDAILVDEVQDYNQSWLKILVKYFLSSDGEFVVFGDEKQNIYNRKMGEDRFPQIPTILGRWNELKQSFRLDNATLQITQAFQRQYFVNRYVLDEDVEPQQNNLFDEKGAIIYQSVAGGSIDDLYNLIQTKISEINVHPNDIVILASAYESIRELEYRFRTLKHENTTNAGETKEEFDRNKSMYGEGTKKFKQALDEIRHGRKLHFWANAGTTKFCTIHSFKGWEADTVILIVSEMQNTDNDICLDELMYVALTRTQRNLMIVDTTTNGRYSNFFKTMSLVEL
jgi:superfamily I DNA/RNA helicase